MKFIPTAVTRTVARSVLKTQMHSPTILFVTGAAGMVVTTVMAARATLRLSDTLDEIISDNDKLSIARVEKRNLYSDRDFLEAKVGLYVRSAGKIVRLYGPTVLVGATSLACLAGAQRIIIRRNAALTAAYGIVDRAYKEYRGRVREEFGEDKELELYHGAEEYERVTTLADGSQKIETTQRAKTKGDDYARFFEKGNPNWVDNPEYNFITLRTAEKFCNNKLRAETFLTLNDVYEILGIPKSSAGQVVGWATGAGGDDYVDFGLFENNESARRFVNGQETAVLLNFNVQGVIYDLIDERQVKGR